MIPLHLGTIKSSGIYRFIWDKSTLNEVPAQILRLVVGYSEKGPFNTPVYIQNQSDFKSIFGGINKKLEKRGVFFHRMSLQALGAGPIIALNLKKFGTNPESPENVGGLTFTPFEVGAMTQTSVNIEDVYDTTRFWKLEPSKLKDIKKGSTTVFNKLIGVTSTDEKKNSNSLFIRPAEVSGYDITIKDWYANYTDEKIVPEYLEGIENSKIKDFFIDVYVFRGKFNKDVVSQEPLSNFFDIEGGKVYLKSFVKNAFGENKDTLDELSKSSSANLIARYTGIILPDFRGTKNQYISIDKIFNNDNYYHQMIMNIDENILETTVKNLTFYDQVTDDLLTNIIKKVTLPTIQCMSNTLNPRLYKTKLNSVGYDTNNVNEFVGLADINSYVTSEEFTINNKIVTINSTENEYAKTIDWKVGDEFVGNDNNIVKLESITYNGDTKITTATFSDNIKNLVIDDTKYVFKFLKGVGNNIGKMEPSFIEGYTYANEKPAENTQIAKLNWQKSILDSLVDYRGMREALKMKSEIDYRYIVDTFDSYVELGCKSTLTLLAKEKGNALAFVNTPSMKTFKECDYVSFTDMKNYFDTKYIAEGGNKIKGPIGFSLPTEGDGAVFSCFTTQFKFSDGTINTYLPSAAIVSNNFMEKYKTRQPYYVVAGPKYGRMNADGLVGPDMNFSRYDLDNLEPMGINAMIYVPRVGTYINSNQTAKQNPVSALSKLNVIELVIYLQDEIEALLRSYQWELNTPDLRAAIKAKADAICANIKTNGGLYDYTNICDETNNTPEIIDNEFVVLSTYIEPAKGSGKMIQELTISRTGELSANIQ